MEISIHSRFCKWNPIANRTLWRLPAFFTAGSLSTDLLHNCLNFECRRTLWIGACGEAIFVKLLYPCYKKIAQPWWHYLLQDYIPLQLASRWPLSGNFNSHAETLALHYLIGCHCHLAPESFASMCMTSTFGSSIALLVCVLKKCASALLPLHVFLRDFCFPLLGRKLWLHVRDNDPSIECCVIYIVYFYFIWLHNATW